MRHAMNTAPLFSIITPVLNRAEFLTAAMASLVAQEFRDFEHIVVDGGSHDGTPEAAERAGAHVIRAAGTGIYAALNLGLEAAQGTWIVLLNSDDLLPPKALVHAHTALASAPPDLDILRGWAALERHDGTDWVSQAELRAQDPTPTLTAALLDSSDINACVIRRTAFLKFGAFDTTFPIAADRFWLARALMAGARTAGVPETLYVYRAHGGSLTIGGRKEATERWVLEHLRFAHETLRKGGLPAVQKRALEAFYGKETAHLAALRLGQGRLLAGLNAMSEGFSRAPLWPFWAASPIVRLSFRRLRLAQERSSEAGSA